MLSVTLFVVMLDTVFYCYAVCRYSECRYAECRGAALKADALLTHDPRFYFTLQTLNFKTAKCTNTLTETHFTEHLSFNLFFFKFHSLKSTDVLLLHKVQSVGTVQGVLKG